MTPRKQVLPDFPVTAAKESQLEEILELLGQYDVGRSYFEYDYLNDPDYAVQDSRIISEAGRIVSHARVFRRSLLIDGVPLLVHGIGTLITDRRYRRQGR